MKKLAILGSTGSIGTQAVEVVQILKGDLSIRALSAHRNGELLLEQAVSLGVKRVCLSSIEAASRYAPVFDREGIELLRGHDGLETMLREEPYDLVLNSLVGSAGLLPTLIVLGRGITLALANKESLVAGGRLVMDASRANDAKIIPVDSEHSALFQCLRGESLENIRRIILTASGGPFRETPVDELADVSVADTLAHPTWSMGRKITVDSATLMNKGLEVLEAHHLFQVGLDNIDVIVHPQSVIHSMVEMVDGSVLAHLGVPDMKIPIQYALTYPERAGNPSRFLSLQEYGALSFEDVDMDRFPCLALAYQAGRSGGTYPAAMNAANEEAVQAFLDERLSFPGIPWVVERVLEGHEPLGGETLDEIQEAQEEARRSALETIVSLEADL